MKILEAKDQAVVRIHGGGNYRRFILKTIKARWNATLFIDWQNVAGKPVRAYVNQSFWAVSCPDCHESIVAQPGEPLFCPNCLNSGNDSKPRAVIFPTVSERQKIETVLLKRINPTTRNWIYPETVADLSAENIAHGEEGL